MPVAIQYTLVDGGQHPRILTTYYWKAATMYPWEAQFSDIKVEYELARYVYNKEINDKRRKEPDLTDQEREILSLIGYDEENDKGNPGLHFSNAGRDPFDFWACLKAYALAWSLRTDQSTASIYHQLYCNTDFAAVCGFGESLPSYRTFARFDQIMTMAGLWEKVRIKVVTTNFLNGYIEPEKQIAVDTTHVEADSVPLPKDSTIEQPTCDNVGVLRKSKTVTYIAHKYSIPTLPKQNVPIAAYAFKGNEADNVTLEPTLVRLFCDYPFLVTAFPALDILVDGIYQTTDNQLMIRELFGPDSRLVCPVHPRNRKDQKVEDINGIFLIDSYGVPHCISKHKLCLLGRDIKHEEYIWGCPVFNPKCQVPGATCDEANHISCCNGNAAGRYYRVKREDTPQINWNFPQHSKTHKTIYNMRTASERAISFLKEAMGFRRLRKRNRVNAQALGDRCVISFHIMIMMAHLMDRPDLMRSWSKMLKIA